MKIEIGLKLDKKKIPQWNPGNLKIIYFTVTRMEMKIFFYKSLIKYLINNKTFY